MVSKFNSSINEWKNSIYMYNKNNLNYKVYNNNSIINSLLDNYFNYNSNFKYNNENIKFINKNNWTKNLFLKAYYLNLNKLINLVKIKKNYELKW